MIFASFAVAARPGRAATAKLANAVRGRELAINLALHRGKRGGGVYRLSYLHAAMKTRFDPFVYRLASCARPQRQLAKEVAFQRSMGFGGLLKRKALGDAAPRKAPTRSAG